jgi:hypothetical protein
MCHEKRKPSGQNCFTELNVRWPPRFNMTAGTWITRRGDVAGRASLVAGLTPQPNLRRRWAFFGDRSSLCGETSITLVLLALFFREASEKRIVCIRKRLHKYLQSIYGHTIIYGPQIRGFSTDFHRFRKTSKVPYRVTGYSPTGF